MIALETMWKETSFLWILLSN